MKRWISFMMIVSCLFLDVSVFAAPKQPLTIKVTENSLTRSQIRLLSKQTIQMNVFRLHAPERLVIDFRHNQLAGHQPKVIGSKHLVQNIRVGVRDKNTLRVVFDVSGIIRVKKKMSANKAQVLLVLEKVKKNITKKATHVKKHAQPLMIAHSKIAKRKVVVVIDPGHGGKDPGAIGRHHTQEKDIVLAIAKELKSQLDAVPGIKAVLTRKRDHYISLRQRLNIARRYHADLFISIHADAYRKTSSFGASVFALSQRGASSEAARWLAVRENTSELGGVHLTDKSYMLRSVLLDLSQTATIGASLKFGQGVLNELGEFASLHNDKVEQARFVVLKSPDIPSVLVETGFISNLKEEKKLHSAAYRKEIAKAITNGVKAYFKYYGPENTVLASKSRQHTKQKG